MHVRGCQKTPPAPPSPRVRVHSRVHDCCVLLNCSSTCTLLIYIHTTQTTHTRCRQGFHFLFDFFFDFFSLSGKTHTSTGWLQHCSGGCVHIVMIITCSTAPQPYTQYVFSLVFSLVSPLVFTRFKGCFVELFSPHHVSMHNHHVAQCTTHPCFTCAPATYTHTLVHRPQRCDHLHPPHTCSSSYTPPPPLHHHPPVCRGPHRVRVETNLLGAGPCSKGPC